LDNEETKISDVYAYTVVDARRRAAQRALETLMKKQPSHVNLKKNKRKRLLRCFRIVDYYK
jgi:hypothetical protein